MLLLVPTRALAQSDEAYRARIQEAVAEFDAHRFVEARALFRQAHELSPNARTLRGIGLASFEMGDYVEAYRALRASLVHALRPLTDTQRASAQSVLERARRFVGVYTLDVTPAVASLRVDGAAPRLEPDGRLVLALGQHALLAEAVDHEAARATLAVRGGEEQALTLVCSPAPASAEPVAPAAGAVPARVSAESSGADVAPGAITLAAGGALAVAAIALGPTWWLGREQEISRCLEAADECRNLDELNGARDAAAGVTSSLAALGVVGLVWGAIWWATSDAPASGEVACLPLGAGLSCAGTF